MRLCSCCLLSLSHRISPILRDCKSRTLEWGHFISFEEVLKHSSLQWSITTINVPCFLSTNRTANVLCTAANIKQGDRLMILVHRIPEYWLIQLACIRTGKSFKLNIYIYVCPFWWKFYLTIRLWARDFYDVIVDEVEGRNCLERSTNCECLVIFLMFLNLLELVQFVVSPLNRSTSMLSSV